MLYPLRFQPLYRQYLWGGRRFESVLGRSLGPGNYAESWELVDHVEDQSIVQHGPLAGKTLHALVNRYGEHLFGVHHPQTQFPLLFKFLDAHRNLSVQVHPNDAQGASLDPPELGKTEAWVILHADPGSLIYAGLNEGVDRELLARQIAVGATESCLHKVWPKVGDCLFVPAGTVHALGAGLVVAEIQQSSDTTYRLFDWNRKDADGRFRQLHVAQALDVINFNAGPVEPQLSQPTDDPNIECLVDCDQFVLQRWVCNSAKRIDEDGRCHLLAVLSGAVSIEKDPAESPVRRGESILVPAAAGNVLMTPDEPSVLLHITLPC